MSANMTRPEWGPRFSMPGGLILCNCGTVLHSVQDTRFHWQNGHFDIPETRESTEEAVRKEKARCAQIAQDEYLYHEAADFQTDFDKGGSSAARHILTRINQ